MNQPNSPSKKAVTDAAARTLVVAESLLALLETDERDAMERRLRPMLERLSLGIFRVVVMGEIKKGKSSFINALIGDHGLLPTASDIATSTVYKLIYGPQRAFTVFFQPDPEALPDAEAPTLDITSNQLVEFGTEDGNPANAKRVDFIGVELPNPILRDGLVIVDTPGVGGLFKHHREISFRYAPNADAVIFVLDSVEAVITANEVKFLTDLRKLGAPLIFVQTKTDAAGLEQVEAWRNRNLDILAEKLEIPRNEIAYFPVSAKLKRFADEDQSVADLRLSGYLPLMQYLNETLIRQKTDLLARQTVALIAREAAVQWGRLVESRRVYQATNRDRLAELETRLTEARQRVAEWEGDAMRRERLEVSRKLGDAQRFTRKSLHDSLEPQAGVFITTFCKRAETQLTDLEKIEMHSNGFLGDCVFETIQWVQQTLADYREQVLKGCALSVAELEKSMSETIRSGDTFLGPIRGEVEMTKSGMWNKITSIGLGASKGMQVGSAGTSLLGVGLWAVGMLNPVVPFLTFAALAATLYGAKRGYSDGKEREHKQALDKVKQALRASLQQAYLGAMNSLEDVGVKTNRAFEDAVSGISQTTRQQLQTREAEVRAARKNSAEENKQREAVITRNLEKLDALKLEIKALLAA
jgi:GTPase Era involved in 16S rRNA processing